MLNECPQVFVDSIMKPPGSNCSVDTKYHGTVIIAYVMDISEKFRDTMLQAGRSQFRVPLRSLHSFFNLYNPSSRNMALCSTQSLTEMSTTKISGG
jgi:hypothetical protein